MDKYYISDNCYYLNNKLYYEHVIRNIEPREIESKEIESKEKRIKINNRN